MQTPSGNAPFRVVGEFAVIVVGVLVALAVDAWQERRGEEALAREHLHALISDLNSDSVRFVYIRNNLEAKKASLTVLQQIASGTAPDVSPDSVIRLLYPGAVLGWRMPPPQNSAYTELMSTGGLRLIDDPQLRSILVSYYEDWEHQTERLDRHRGSYPTEVYRMLPPEALHGQVMPRDAAAVVARIRTDRMRAELNHEANNALLITQILEAYLPRLAQLVDAVRSYLDGR